MFEYTLLGIKPDAFSPENSRESGSELRLRLPDIPEDFIDEIKILILERSLSIILEKRYIVPPHIAQEHYKEHAGVWDKNYQQNKQDFLVEYLTSGESHWFVLEGDDAIRKGREIIINLREKYLIDRKLARYNMTHASDSIESAKQEIRLHFPKIVLIS